MIEQCADIAIRKTRYFGWSSPPAKSHGGEELAGSFSCGSSPRWFSRASLPIKLERVVFERAFPSNGTGEEAVDASIFKVDSLPQNGSFVALMPDRR